MEYLAHISYVYDVTDDDDGGGGGGEEKAAFCYWFL